MAKTIIKKITEAAEELYQLRRKIEQVEEENRLLIEPLKTKRDGLQQDLIAQLSKQGLSSVKVSTGDSVCRVAKKGVEVTSLPHALDWAIQNRAVNINKIIAGQLLRNAKVLPQGFALVESEYISVRKGKTLTDKK